MPAQKFSKKEAIAHGIKMTKKYFGIIFILLLIYAGFQIVSGILEQRAGAARMKKEDVKTLYKEPAAVDHFYEHFKESGYIDKYGKVRDKLKDIQNPKEVVLPADLEGDRDRIFEFLQPYRYRLPFPKSIYHGLYLALWIISMLMGVGIVKISLMLSRDQEPAVADLFSGTPLLIKYILGMFCGSLAVFGGMILLIVPGIILAVMLSQSQYLIVDQNMGPIEALKGSRSITKGSRRQLFYFGILIGLFNLGGLLCLVVGVLFTMPASCIASAYVYDQLRKREEAAVVGA